MNRTFCTLIALAASVYIAPFQAQLRSFELLAEIVKPHFNGSNALRQTSYARVARNIGDYRQTGQSAVAAATEAYQAREKQGRGD